jgi:hypothetical protein
MRSDLDSVLVNVPAEVQKLHDEKARLIKRLTEIHAEIEAWGYLHPNNRPARADRGEPTPWAPAPPSVPTLPAETDGEP